MRTLRSAHVNLTKVEPFYTALGCIMRFVHYVATTLLGQALTHTLTKTRTHTLTLTYNTLT